MPAKRRRNELWYKDGLRFECRRCNACCGGFPGYVWLTEDELERAAAFLGASPEEFAEEYTRRIGERYTLREVENWNCIMLTDSGCRMYPVRPSQCRTFPFWDENLQKREYWDAASTACPGMNEGRLYSCEEIERLRSERIR